MMSKSLRNFYTLMTGAVPPGAHLRTEYLWRVIKLKCWCSEVTRKPRHMFRRLFRVKHVDPVGYSFDDFHIKPYKDLLK